MFFLLLMTFVLCFETRFVIKKLPNRETKNLNNRFLTDE
jgi:hypothetical protein